MRKAFTIILCACMFHFATAQEESRKGDLSIALAGIPMYYKSANTTGFYGATARASLGVFISNSFSIENSVFYYLNNRPIVNDDEGYSESIGLQFSLRYNMFFCKDKIVAYAELGPGFGYMKYMGEEYKGNIAQYNTTIGIIAGGIGVRFRIFPKLDGEISVPYVLIDNISNKQALYKNDLDMIYTGLAGPIIGFRYNF